jgi:hypothetical protein
MFCTWASKKSVMEKKKCLVSLLFDLDLFWEVILFYLTRTCIMLPWKPQTRLGRF